LAIANTFKDDLLIHHMIRRVSQVCVCQTVERLVNRMTISEADLLSLSAALTVTNLAAIKECMVTERCFGLFWAEYFKSIADQMESGLSRPLSKLFRVYEARLVYHEDDLLQYLEWTQQCFAVLDLPFTNAFVRLRSIEARNEVSRVSFLDGLRRKRLSPLNVVNEPRVSLYLLNEAQGVARVRVTVVALAIQRWRQQHGQELPNSLADLVPAYLPALPTDPFDAVPLRYTRLATNYVVYSVGRDFVGDSQSQTVFQQDESNRFDITFTVESPVAR
jgi:hypothetical protein